MCNVLHFFFRLLNSNNEVLFTCRIIHSVQVMSSVVHVFHRDKMAAVAHVIGADQLPMDSQVHFFLVFCNLYLCMHSKHFIISFTIYTS